MIEEMTSDDTIGAEIYELASDLFPIFRCLTGEGVRQSLDLMARHVPLQVKSVKSGTAVHDWTVPKEWQCRDAWVKGPSGQRVIDVKDNNLHVVGYSTPIHETLRLADLKKHLFTDPAQPDVIPYRTAYYSESWGFCLSQNTLDELADGDYEVMIDATHFDGELNFGEFLHPGESEKEILLTTHCCHPSMANDNCSGMALLTHLARRISQRQTRFSYRFLWIPGTIGAITWLALNEDRLDRVRLGLTIAGVGDAGGPSYKRTRRGDALIDRAMTHLLRSKEGAQIVDFFPYGYDERQFNSPGVALNVGLFQRSPFASFPEYHTSADNLDFIAPNHLAGSFRLIMDALEILEKDRVMLNLFGKGEPQLGRRGLYDAISGSPDAADARMAMLWILNLSDGEHSLLDIAERAGIDFSLVADTADMLKLHGLLVETAAN